MNPESFFRKSIVQPPFQSGVGEAEVPRARLRLEWSGDLANSIAAGFTGLAFWCHDSDVARWTVAVAARNTEADSTLIGCFLELC